MSLPPEHLPNDAAHAPTQMPVALVFVISIMMILTALTTALISRSHGAPGAADATARAAPPDLEMLFPEEFGHWQRVALGAAILPPESTIGPGEAVVYRAYRNRLGRIVTLVVAYGPPASDSVRLHRPETCYTGQGFVIEWRKRATLTIDHASVPVNRLMARNATRHEAVSYWLRAGDDYAVSAAAHQWINLQQGLGRTADGVLVRISTTGGGDGEFDLHMEFMEQLLASLTPEERSLLIVS